MINLIQNEILFFLSLAFLMFLPGWCLVLAIFRRSHAMSLVEKFIVSFGLSIIILDFLLFAYNKLNVSITRLSVISGILLFSAACAALYFLFCHPELVSGSKKKKEIPKQVRNDKDNDNLFNFSKNQFILICLLLFLTVFVKTIYLSGSIAPTTTDLGHHTYWAKLMADTHRLTDYDGMPDFIIGEHTLFTSMYLLTGTSFLTGWPVVILYLINLLGIFAVFILTLRIFKNKLVAILTLLFLGVLFAVSAPQTKYVSGGVMGNIFGNYLMPLAFYFYYRAFEFLNESNVTAIHQLAEKQSHRINTTFLSLAVFTTFGLFYTHHLTGFIFLFTFALLIPLFLIINYKDIEIVFKKASKVIFSPWVIGTFILGLIFFFLVFTPTYVNPKAVGTAVGTATKSTRVGLTLDNLRDTVGEPRLALGFLGFIILLLGFKRKNFGFSLLAAWTLMLFIMSVFPNLLFVDLPSNRIGNYTSYPLAILSAYAFFMIFQPQAFHFFWGKDLGKRAKGLALEKLMMGSFLVLFTFVLVSGLSDSAQAFKSMDNLKEVSETFSTSSYLAQNTTTNDFLLKDHNYLTADSWMKLFFMRGYKYPESRGYFKRYEDTGNRNDDTCTLDMISNPGSDAAKACFASTKTDFIIINPKYDSGQFLRLPNFNQIYMSPDIAVYYRK